MEINSDSEAPANGQQIITACAFIYKFEADKPWVLMAKRAKTKKFLPDIYELPGGHIDFGEDIEVGLKREILEELSADIRVGLPFAAFTYANKIKKSHSIEVIYFSTFKDPTRKVCLNPEDHSEYKWVNQDNLSDVYSDKKPGDDIEFTHIREGLKILANNKFIYE